LPYQMRAERDNEKVHSRKISVLMAVAKARVWASEGWQVVLTDDEGKTFTPAEFENLWSFDAVKSRPAELHGAGEKRIGLALLPDGGARTVTADEADVVAERQQLVGDRSDQCGVIAAGDVAAAD
jgi:hypothetical protein